jgi:hypothetical protein
MLRRAQQQVVVFLATNTSGVRQTGLTWADGELKLSKDGAALVDLLGARVTEVAHGYYYVTLTAAETDATFLVLAQVKTGISAANDVRGLTSGHPSGVVIDDAANSATTFKTDRTETGPDHWVSTGVKFTTGALAGQIREITAYNGTTKFLTVSPALSAEPAAGDRFTFADI